MSLGITVDAKKSLDVRLDDEERLPRLKKPNKKELSIIDEKSGENSNS